MMANEQQPADGLPQINIDDLLKMIGDRDVTISRQASLINSQSIRIAELEEAEASSVTTTAFNASTGTTG